MLPLLSQYSLSSKFVSLYSKLFALVLIFLFILTFLAFTKAKLLVYHSLISFTIFFILTFLLSFAIIKNDEL